MNPHIQIIKVPPPVQKTHFAVLFHHPQVAHDRQLKPTSNTVPAIWCSPSQFLRLAKLPIHSSNNWLCQVHLGWSLQNNKNFWRKKKLPLDPGPSESLPSCSPGYPNYQVHWAPRKWKVHVDDKMAGIELPLTSRSYPEQKLPPSPCKTAQCRSGSCSNSLFINVS